MVLVKGVNSSFNRCATRSGIASSNTQSTTEHPYTCTLLFCSLVNNNSTKSIIISLVITYGNKQVTSCNVIDNSHDLDSSTAGIILINGNCKIYDSHITGNKANYTFYQASRAYKVTVNNCTLDTDISSKISASIIITNETSIPSIIPLFHLNTGNCEAENTRKERNVRTKFSSLNIPRSIISCLIIHIEHSI